MTGKSWWPDDRLLVDPGFLRCGVVLGLPDGETASAAAIALGMQGNVRTETCAPTAAIRVLKAPLAVQAKL